MPINLDIVEGAGSFASVTAVVNLLLIAVKPLSLPTCARSADDVHLSEGYRFKRCRTFSPTHAQHHSRNAKKLTVAPITSDLT
jgi:hypothetical protein